MPLLYIQSETATLRTVILGIPDSFGGTPEINECYDPKSRLYVTRGEFPSQEDIDMEMEALVAVFHKYSVQVLRPKNIDGLNQIFARDIGFVVGTRFFVPNIIEDRQPESAAISYIIDQIDEKNIVRMPAGTRVEGGDVLVHHDHLFVGYSKDADFDFYTVSRTNQKGLDFLKESITDKNVIGFELNKSDLDPYKNALHLDCCFQPVGRNCAIIYRGGFKNTEDVDYITNLFGSENLIFVSEEEMFEMHCNVFSISENVVISEKGFTTTNEKLKKLGIKVEEVPYSQIAKMEGLFRCSTMPLERI